MRRVNTFILLFLSQIVLGQSGTITIKRPAKTLKVIFKSKAFKIVGDTVQIDTCYDIKSSTFTIDRLELVKKNPLYLQLINQTNLSWRQMEADINATKCDSLAPYRIEIIENNITESFSLKRIGICYPNSAKQIMERLDNYFAKFR